jgi:2-oxoisovalerate dehydrogenase E2 component (dihydrolipoyl transacylase)
VQACSLVTADDASSATAKTLTQGSEAAVPGACFYASADGKTDVIVFAQVYADASAAQAVSIDQIAAALTGAGNGLGTATVVSGIGDKALEYSVSSSGSTGLIIIVFKSNVLLMIAMLPTPAQDPPAIRFVFGRHRYTWLQGVPEYAFGSLAKGQAAMSLAQIKMPQLGESVTEGTVDKWLKNEGDFVKRDEPLVEVVTDKVNAEIPSPFEGKLVKIAAASGETVRVGAVIAQIEVGAAAAARPDAAKTPAPSQPEAAAANAAAGAPVARAAAPAAVVQAAREPLRLSPAVRKLVAEHGVDVASLRGTGMGGRVTRDDVLAALGGTQAAPIAVVSAPAPTAKAPAPAATSPVRIDGAREELVKLSVMRRSIAEHMVRSLATSPHAWTLQEVDVTNLVRYREAEKESFKARHGMPLTYLPFVVQIVCGALKEYPWLNSTWTDEGVIVKRYINLGIAVSIPDGLIVPVIKDADQRGFTDMVRSLNDLIERARNKQLRPEDVQGGTFTLNNTGATGSIASQPIINQPQAAILTTESIVKRAVVIGDAIAVRHMMNMCLSFDHRIIDGMMAGQFLSAVKKRLDEWTPGSIQL